MLFYRTNKTTTHTPTNNTAATVKHHITSSAPYASGTVIINGVRYDYTAKVYNTPSEMGIRNGKISKLTIISRNKVVFNYDRGYDIRATGDVKTVVSTITKYYK